MSTSTKAKVEGFRLDETVVEDDPEVDFHPEEMRREADDQAQAERRRRHAMRGTSRVPTVASRAIPARHAASRKSNFIYDLVMCARSLGIRRVTARRHPREAT